jgi:hypothetical protein
MSVQGQTRKSMTASVMSVIGVTPEVSDSYSEIDPPNVCFQGYSGPQFTSSPLPLCARRRHWRSWLDTISRLRKWETLFAISTPIVITSVIGRLLFLVVHKNHTVAPKCRWKEPSTASKGDMAAPPNAHPNERTSKYRAAFITLRRKHDKAMKPFNVVSSHPPHFLSYFPYEKPDHHHFPKPFS